jgi:hypothetical protein
MMRCVCGVTFDSHSRQKALTTACTSMRLRQKDSIMNKFVQARPYADPEVAARKIIELAHGFEAYPGRPHQSQFASPTSRLCRR